MDRPLHAVFTELLNDEVARQAYAADPAGFLAGTGHEGLPNDLVAEAVISFADTAPPTVAEHLAVVVKAYGPVPDAAAEGDGSGEIGELDGLAVLAATPPHAAVDSGHDDAAESIDTAATQAVFTDHARTADDLDFGAGSDVTELSTPPSHDVAAELDVTPLDDIAAPAPAIGEEFLTPGPIAEPVDDPDTTEDGHDAGQTSFE